ncbi:MAG: hypothetical protein Q9201_001600 [Fulgogasparrea decipioides]
MSASPQKFFQSARVSKETFLSPKGFLWAGTVISLGFVAFRLVVRMKSFRKLYADDYLVILAWTLLLGTSLTWQIMGPILYDYYAIQAQKKLPGPDFQDKYAAFLRTIVPFTLLFYSTLWAVKLSFLLFFWRLGSKVRGHNIWWWVVLGITVAAYIACIGDVDYRCCLSSMEWIVGEFEPVKTQPGSSEPIR